METIKIPKKKFWTRSSKLETIHAKLSDPLLKIAMQYHKKAYKKKSIGYFKIYDDCI